LGRGSKRTPEDNGVQPQHIKRYALMARAGNNEEEQTLKKLIFKYGICLSAYWSGAHKREKNEAM